jgi:hypothetical protein
MTRPKPLATLLVALVLAATPACATYGADARYPQSLQTTEARAYDVGYREGFEEGRDDARHARPYDPSRHHEFRDADSAYRGGNRNAYRRLFRDGFTAGYDDAYRQFGRLDGRNSQREGSWGSPNDERYPAPVRAGRLTSRASENGYRDGYAQGRDDARDGDRYDPVRAKWYGEGDHGYSGQFGDRDDYKRDYRDAFQRGYEQGYREVRR